MGISSISTGTRQAITLVAETVEMDGMDGPTMEDKEIAPTDLIMNQWMTEQQ